MSWKMRFRIRPNPSFYTSIVASSMIGAMAFGVFKIGGVRAIAVAVMCFFFLGAISAIVHDEVM